MRGSPLIKWYSIVANTCIYCVLHVRIGNWDAPDTDDAGYRIYPANFLAYNLFKSSENSPMTRYSSYSLSLKFNKQ